MAIGSYRDSAEYVCLSVSLVFILTGGGSLYHTEERTLTRYRKIRLLRRVAARGHRLRLLAVWSDEASRCRRRRTRCLQLFSRGTNSVQTGGSGRVCMVVLAAARPHSFQSTEWIRGDDILHSQVGCPGGVIL